MGLHKFKLTPTDEPALSSGRHVNVSPPKTVAFSTRKAATSATEIPLVVKHDGNHESESIEHQPDRIMESMDIANRRIEVSQSLEFDYLSIPQSGLQDLVTR